MHLHRPAVTHGVRGVLLAGWLFLPPGAVAVMDLKWIYATDGEPGFASAILRMKAVVLAVALQAVVRVGKTEPPSKNGFVGFCWFSRNEFWYSANSAATKTLRTNEITLPEGKMMLKQVFVAGILATIATGAVAGGPERPTGLGYMTAVASSQGKVEAAHFDEKGTVAPLDNPAAGNVPSGGLPGFGADTAGQGGVPG